MSTKCHLQNWMTFNSKTGSTGQSDFQTLIKTWVRSVEYFVFLFTVSLFLWWGVSVWRAPTTNYDARASTRGGRALRARRALTARTGGRGGGEKVKHREFFQDTAPMFSVTIQRRS